MLHAITAPVTTKAILPLMGQTMFENNFDPYDILISLNDRMNRLENIHNQMVAAHYRLEADLKNTQYILRQLQQKHLELQTRFNRGEYNVTQPNTGAIGQI